MAFIHHCINSDAGAVRGRFDFIRELCVLGGISLHHLKARVARDFEALGIALVLGQHAE